jgi:hypothetical protein
MSYLKQYIRENVPLYATDDSGNTYRLVGRPRRIGVLVSTGPGKIGYSIISPKENLSETYEESRKISINGKEKTVKVRLRKFTGKYLWSFGTKLAEQRAEGAEQNPTIFEEPIKRQISDFEKRMKRYYKN